MLDNQAPDQQPLEGEKSQKRKYSLLFGFLLVLILCGIPVGFLASFGNLGDSLVYYYTMWKVSQEPPVIIYETATLSPGSYWGYDHCVALTKSETLSEALQCWDEFVLHEPQNPYGYYMRGITYQGLTQNQRSQTEFTSYLEKALNDLNIAIEKYEEQDDLSAPLFAARADIYADLMAIEEYRANREKLAEIWLENLRAAEKLGASQSVMSSIPAALVTLNRCDEALQEIKRIGSVLYVDQPDHAAKDKGLLYLSSITYQCQGDLESALASIHQSYDLLPTLAKVSEYATVLYLMDRPEEALALLDQSITESPHYNGLRYYLRALIYFDQGNLEQAKADLEVGSGNTWGRGGYYAYVQGKIALLEGDQALGIEWLQLAEATFDWQERTMLERVQKELTELGAAQIDPPGNPFLKYTPMPPLD